MNPLSIALTQYKVREFIGSGHNPQVLKYFDATRFEGQSWITDETAWCSAFMNWCAEHSGLEKSGELNARSWLEIGEKVEVPQPGDVVILWRESKTSWKGHVGIYVNEKGSSINVLGGNQNNEVNISPYPKEQLLGYRRLGIKQLEL